jgi:L-alanine-DL-glutamate epimerase-like enolase superfamily enzyme
MKIHRLTAFHVPVVLRKPVHHASHSRSVNETVVIRCVMCDGSLGWGEGLPRPYVTGETIQSAWRHLQQTDFTTLCEHDFGSALELAEHFDQFSLATTEPDPGIPTRECFGNSVRCALEIAMLDAACRAEQCSLSDLICRIPSAASLIDRVPEVRYSGAITSMSPAKQWISALKMRAFGFRSVKVKVGTPGVNDAECLRRVRGVVGRRVDLRIDANEAWHCAEVRERIAPLRRFHPTCLEQPVPHAEVAGLSDVRRELDIPIMLDESLCSIEDARRAVAGQWCDLFNVRLSKCGGLLRSLQMMTYAQQHGLGYQLGCQVGETGILSAAGRHVACSVGGIRYLEGSFDRFLVRDAFTEQDLTFRYGGKARPLTGQGLSVDVNECRIRQVAVKTIELFPRSGGKSHT